MRCGVSFVLFVLACILRVTRDLLVDIQPGILLEYDSVLLKNITGPKVSGLRTCTRGSHFARFPEWNQLGSSFALEGGRVAAMHFLVTDLFVNLDDYPNYKSNQFLFGIVLTQTLEGKKTHRFRWVFEYLVRVDIICHVPTKHGGRDSPGGAR